MCQASRLQVQELSQGALGMDGSEAKLFSELLENPQEPEMNCAVFFPDLGTPAPPPPP